MKKSAIKKKDAHTIGYDDENLHRFLMDMPMNAAKHKKESQRHTKPWDVPHQQKMARSFDGTPIGYQIVGDPKKPAFLLANGLGGTFRAYRFVIDRFIDDFCFYCWDYRGLYTSGRPLAGAAALSVDAHAADGAAILDAEGIQDCVALGWSMGVQVLVEMQRRYHARFRGLLLHNGLAGSPYETLGNTTVFRHIAAPVLRTLQRMDGLVTKVTRSAVDFPYFVPLTVHLGAAHAELDRAVFLDVARGFKQLDMHLYLELLKKLGEHDGWSLLPKINVPTLLLSSSNDFMAPPSAMRRMAESIPNAELAVINGGSHYAAVEFPELVNRHLEAFLLRHQLWQTG